MEYQLYKINALFDLPLLSAFPGGHGYMKSQRKSSIDLHYCHFYRRKQALVILSLLVHRRIILFRMMDVVGTCYRLVGDLLHSLSGHCKPVMKAVDDESTKQQQGMQLDELAARALTAVFGMDSNGRIKKEKARCVVQKLGLIGKDEEGFGFEEGEELRAEEIVRPAAAEEETNEVKRAELLRRAFMVFDKDGDGFIDSSEVKRVLECLGLVERWEMGEFERMVKVAGLNFNGKVDFAELELMMSAK